MTAITQDNMVSADPIFQRVHGQTSTDDLAVHQAVNDAAIDFCERSEVLIDQANDVGIGANLHQPVDLEFQTDAFVPVRIIGMRYTRKVLRSFPDKKVDFVNAGTSNIVDLSLIHI